MAYWSAADGGQIYYEHHRGGDRPVVLIHGWGMSCRVWDSVLPTLRERDHEILAFDQRGCGRSDKDFASASIDDLIADTAGMIEALDLDGVVLNGWSLGGAVATGTAAMIGDRAAAVVLTCGASPRYTQADGFAHGGTPQDVRDTFAALRADRAAFLHGLSRAVCAKPVGAPVEDWLWSIFMETAPVADESLLALAELDQRAIMQELAVPLLSIIGSDDGFTPPGIGEFAAELAPNGTLERFEGCGHAPFLEATEQYCAVLTRFIDTLG